MEDMKNSEFAKLANRIKMNKCTLPRVEWFRVDVDGGTGTAVTWHETGYRIIVKLQGIEGEYATSTVAAAYGMKVKRIYKTAEEAKADGFKFKKEWGRSASKAGQKREDEKQKAVDEATNAVIDKMRTTLKAMGLFDTAIDAIIAQAQAK
jgi:hypothetical protein